MGDFSRELLNCADNERDEFGVVELEVLHFRVADGFLLYGDGEERLHFLRDEPHGMCG